MKYNRLEDLQDIEGKRALVRVDFNVPQDEHRNVTDDTRIRAAIPTIRYLQEKGCSLVLCSHLGRPKGQISKKFRMLPVAKQLAQVLHANELPDEVLCIEDTVGENVEECAADLKPGQIMLIENLRFEVGEKKNDKKFAANLAKLGEFYVNDAFGVSHRAHASVNALPQLFEQAAAGFLVDKELAGLSHILESTEKPSLAIIGGAKVSDKITMIQNLARICDHILIGGAMAFTFLKANGQDVGQSRVEEDKLELAQKIQDYCRLQQCQLHLPTDFVCAETFSEDAEPSTHSSIPETLMGLDIGPDSQASYAELIRSAKRIFWNGPMGVFEWESFAAGTKCVGEAMAKAEGYTVIGGGDSAAAAAQFGFADQMNHVSTGGGASLALIEGSVLPGIEHLS